MSSPSRDYSIYDSCFFYIRDVSDTSVAIGPQRGELMAREAFCLLQYSTIQIEMDPWPASIAGGWIWMQVPSARHRVTKCSLIVNSSNTNATPRTFLAGSVIHRVLAIFVKTEPWMERGLHLACQQSAEHGGGWTPACLTVHLSNLL